MDSEVPDGLCGFRLSPSDLNGELGENYNDGDHHWFVEFSIATCLRESWNNTGRCIWHADVDEKPISELQTAYMRSDELLDGIVLRGVDLRNRLSFSCCRLAGADLSDANLRGADFSEADLWGAELSGVNLRMADLTNSNLQEAKLTEACLDGALLSEAYLPWADLTKAEATQIDLTNADLRCTNMSETDLSNANLSKADLGEAFLSKADLFDANLSESILDAANLTEANLIGANLSEANLRSTYLTNSNLPGANLSGADLRTANLSEASLSRANLSKANLHGVNLSNADLSNCTLTGAMIEDANLEDVDLRGTNLRKARFYQTSFADTRINSETEFGKECWYDDSDYDIDSKFSNWRWEDTTLNEAAVWTYRRLEDIHEQYAQIDRARHYHRKKENARKKLHWEEGNYWKWAAYAANGFLSRHGEDPWRVIRVSIYTILVFGVLYPLVGGMARSTEATEAVTFLSPPAIQLPEPVAILFSNIYFSAVTFTTLGYGDIQPATGVAEALAMVESFIGALLMALLVFVLGRQTNW